MTNRILKSIKTKNKLWNKLVKVNIDDEIAYTNLKAEFTDYKKILRRCINEGEGVGSSFFCPLADAHVLLLCHE